MTTKSIDTIVIKTDGAARGNPGPAGVGVVISDLSGRVLKETGRYIGEATNNIAEYRGLILGLQMAALYQAGAIKIRLDSELLVKQLRGAYKVKNAGLKPLHSVVQELIGSYRQVDFEHIPREENKEADRLANKAIDKFDDGEIKVEPAVDVPEQGKLF